MKSHAVFERGTLAPIPFLESDPVYTIHKGQIFDKIKGTRKPKSLPPDDFRRIPQGK